MRVARFVLPRLFLFALLFPFMDAAAQDLAGLEQGIRPYGSYHGGDIDSVSMVNLKPNIRIPLISYPQRGGKLKVSFAVVLSIPASNPMPQCHTVKPYNCYYINWTSTAPSLGGNASGGQLAIVNEGQVDWSCFPCAQQLRPQPYQISEPDGAVHRLGQMASGWTSLDATDWLYYPSNFVTDSHGVSIPYSNLVIDRNGVRYSWGTATNTPNNPYLSTIEDPNGNFITTDVNTGSGASTKYIDTLGRRIPYPPPVGGTTTSDYSGCTGSLPITSALLWTPPGPNGGSSTFKFCYATVSVNIPYDCPSGATCIPTGNGGNVIQSIVLLICPNSSRRESYDA
jgi:hypothetical protein